MPKNNETRGALRPILSPADLLRIILYFLLFAGLFYATSTYMVSRWEGDDYNYCYFIPFVFLYLLWEKRRELAGYPSSPSWLGFIPFGLGLGFYWLGELGGEYYSLYLSSWLLLVGLCWAHLGWEKLKIISFPLVFLLTMFPFPTFINDKITLNLKLISSQIGVFMMQLYGQSAYREGNVIDLGFAQLQVVDACSGLRFLISLIVLGILIAYYFKTAFWKRAIVVFSTIPLAVITNSLRIALTGVLYEVWGARVAEGFFHDFSGWVIFMITLVTLLLEVWVIRKIFPDKSEAAKTADSSLEPAGFESARADNVGNFFRPPQFVVAALLLAMTMILFNGVEFREKVPINKPFELFPLQVGEWAGTRQTMARQIINSLDLSDYVIIDFKDGNDRQINFYTAYYESQRKGESIHSPASCLPGSGWIFKEAGGVTIPVPSGNGESLQVNRAFMQKGDVRQLSYYWFPQRGRNLTNAYQLKMYVFWDALTRHRTDGALVRVITSIYEDEELQDAEKRMQAFVGQIVKVLPEFIPE